jgi:hypothetical protein
VDELEEQLVEIARAEAVLNQRDPALVRSVVRAQIAHMATQRTREAQAAAILAAVEAHERRRRRQRIAGAILGVAAIAAAVPMVKHFMKESRRNDGLREWLDRIDKPAADRGFRLVKEWIDVPPEGVTVTAPRETCSALAAVGEGEEWALGFTLEREVAGKAAAASGVVFCSCEAEKVTIKLAPPSGRAPARSVLRWRSAPASVTGGAERMRMDPVSTFVTVEDAVSASCADAAFKVWSASAGNGDLAPLDAARTGPTAKLVADGFEPVGLLDEKRMFGVLRAKKGTCYVAAPEEGRSDFGLRAADGARLVPATRGAAVLCAHGEDAVFSIWRAEGASAPVVVLGAPAERAGGIAGARAAAERLRLREVKAALPSTDLSRDARAALVALGVPVASITEADANGLPGKEDARVAAFTLRANVALLPQVSPPVPTECVSAQAASDPLRTVLCVEARPQPWRAGDDAAHQGGAEGPLPFWMGLLKDEADLEAVKVKAKLAQFALRLGSLGFEATVTDGVKDTAEGAVIAGRGGKGEVVAVGLVRSRPWVVPLSDGVPWTLDGALHVTKIPAGESKTLRGALPLGADPKQRRVVAFRR